MNNTPELCAAELEKLFTETMATAFVYTGEKLTAETKDALDSGSSGRLADTLGYTYRTTGNGAFKNSPDIAEERYGVGRASEDFSLNFGTAMPYAPYVEHGSAPLSGQAGGGAMPGTTFRGNMNDWLDSIGVPKDDFERREAIIADVAANGIEAKHFMPTPQYGAEVLKKAVTASVTRVFKLPNVSVSL